MLENDRDLARLVGSESRDYARREFGIERYVRTAADVLGVPRNALWGPQQKVDHTRGAYLGAKSA